MKIKYLRVILQYSDTFRMMKELCDTVVIILIAALFGGTMGFAQDAPTNAIVFDSDRSGRSQIYIQNLDANGAPIDAPIQVTTAGAGNQQSQEPDWSKAAGKIVYQFGASGVRGIHTINPDGTGDIRIIPEFNSQIAIGPWAGAYFPCQDSRDPVWSPDGRYIAYSCLIGSNYDIWIHVNSQGTYDDPLDFDYPLLTLSNSLELRPAWSPDGKMIAFVTNAPSVVGTGPNSKIAVTQVKPALFFYDDEVVDGIPFIQTLGSYSILTDDSYTNSSPTWSADSQMIAYSTNRRGGYDIYRMSAKYGVMDIANLLCLTTSAASDKNPAWSPDGLTIAFVSDRSGTNLIYLMSAVAGDPATGPYVTIGGCDDGSCLNSNPAWQPQSSAPLTSLTLTVSPDIITVISGDAMPTGGGTVTVKDGLGNAVFGSSVTIYPPSDTDHSLAFHPLAGWTDSNGTFVFTVAQSTQQADSDYLFRLIASDPMTGKTGTVDTRLRVLSHVPDPPHLPGPIPVPTETRIPIGQPVFTSQTKLNYAQKVQNLTVEAMAELVLSGSGLSAVVLGSPAWEIYGAGHISQLYSDAVHYAVLANDPPDQDFDDIALPFIQPLPTIMGSGGPFSLNTLILMNQSFAGKSISSAYLGALVTSLNRYSTALSAGDLTSANLQRNAILAYEDTLALLLQNDATVTKNLLSSLLQDAIPNVEFAESDVAAMQSDMATSGLPSQMVQLLEQLGLTATDIEAVKNNFVATPPASISGTFFGFLQAEAATSQEASVTFALSSPPQPQTSPVLLVTSTHSGSFRQGQKNATYSIAVRNAANAPATSGMVTVTESLPNELTLVSMTGLGWTCNANTCYRSDVLGGGEDFPPITATVNVASSAFGALTNRVSVSGGGATEASSTDITTIKGLAGMPPLNWLGGGHTGGVLAVTAAQDGTAWSAGGDGTAKQWTAANMSMLRTFPGSFVGTPAFAANGERGMFLTSSGVQVLNLADASVVRTFEAGDLGNGAGIMAIAANGQTYAYERSFWRGRFLIFANGQGQEFGYTASVYGESYDWGASWGGVEALAVSADGQYIATVFSADYLVPGTIRVYRVSDGALVRTLTHNTSSVRALAFSADGNFLASSSADGKINVLRLSDLVVVMSVTVWESGNLVAGTSLAFSPDENLIAQGDAYAARIYNVNTAASVARIPGNTSSVSFTPDGQWLAVGTNHDVRLWTVASMAPLPSVVPHFGAVTTVAYSPKGDLVASGSNDYTVKLWRAADGVAVATLSGQTGPINSIAFSPDGDLIASASADHTIRVWRTSDYMLVATLTGHSQSVRTISFSPDGSLLASGSAAPEQVVKLWQVGGSWSNTATLTGTGGGVSSVQFSPDGLKLASGSDGGVIRIWQVAGGSIVQTYLAPSSGSLSLSWSPDGQILAAGWQQNVLVFQGAQSAPILNLPAHSSNGTVVAYSPDGTRLLSGNADSTIKIWNTSSWSVETTYTKETNGITSVGYSRDNTRFVYGRSDATIAVVGNPDSTSPLPISVTVVTNPPGLAVTVDGVSQATPYVFTSMKGSNHTINAASPQGSSGTRQVFQAWSDGGAQNHLISPVASRIYSASFTTQYLLTGQVSPVAGGTISNSPTSTDGYYNSGTSVQITASPSISYVFNNWSGDVIGTVNPTTISMTQPHAITAVFGTTAMSDISVTMTSSLSQVNSGKPLSYTITVANLGPASFSPVLTDSLPAALSFVSSMASQGSCSGTVLISCNLGSIAAGGSATVTINVTSIATGVIANIAFVNAGTSDPNPDNNGASVDVTVLPAGQPPVTWMGGAMFRARSIIPTTDGIIWAAGAQSPTEVQKWRASDMQLLKTMAPDIEMADYRSAAPDLAVTSDGQYLAYPTAAGIGVYRSDGSLVRKFGTGYWPSISEDGQTIAYKPKSPYSSVYIGHVVDGSTTALSVGTEAPHAISPDGQLIAVSISSTSAVQLFRASDGSYIRSLTGFSGYPDRLVWAADSDLLMAASSAQLKVWRISDFLELMSIALPGSYFHSATMSRDGQYVAFAGRSDLPYGGYCRVGPDAQVWRVDDGSQVASIQIPFTADEINNYSMGCSQGVAFTPNNSWLILGNGRLSAWALPQGAASPYLTGGYAAAAAIAYAPAGNLIATAGYDPKIMIWDASTGHASAVIETGKAASAQGGNTITGLSFSTNGNLLAAGVDNSSVDHKVVVWSTAGYGQVQVLSGHSQTVTAVAFSPDGMLLASASLSPEKSVKLWSTQTWTLVRTLTGASDSLRSVQFSPDGTTLVAGGDDGIAREWNVTTGAVIRSYIAPAGGAMRIQYSPDGGKLAAGWTTKVLIFNKGTSTPIRTLSAHTANNTTVAWSPDGSRLVSGNNDGTVDVWDTATWGQLSQYNQETYSQNGGVLTVAYSPDGSQFAYGRADGVMVVVNSGAPPTGTLMTVTTNPPGLNIVVDGSTLVSPQDFRWAAGTNHTIGVPTPQGAGGTRNIYQSWNDGGAQSHTITTPATNTSYTAQFSSQYLLTPVVSPLPAGSILVTPPSSDGFYAAGTAIQAVATSNTGYLFSTWTGDATGSTNPASVTMNGPRNVTAAFSTLPTTTINTSPSGLAIVVDGSTYAAPQQFYWTAGTSHTIAVSALQGAPPIRYSFATWSDAGARSHTITAPSASIDYTATFATQYALDLVVSPVGAGSIVVDPSSTDGYYNSGTAVQLTAAAASGYEFLNWSGDLTGTTNPQSVTLNTSRTVNANFQLIFVPQTLNASGLGNPVNGGVKQPINASLGWTDTNGSPQESGYRIRIKASGGIYANHTVGQNITGYELTLLPNTTYYWNVQAIGNGSNTLDSAWANGGTDWSFTTGPLRTVQYGMNPNATFQMVSPPSPTLIDSWTGSVDDGYYDLSLSALEFDFQFYGNQISNARISTNGYITFGTNGTAPFNVAIPTADLPNGLIAPFWDDLYAGGLSGAQGVNWGVTGTAPNRHLVIWWHQVPSTAYKTETYDFQVVLYESSGKIKFQYQNVVSGTNHDRGVSATVGIENFDGTQGTQYSFNSAALSNGQAIEFIPIRATSSDFDGDGNPDILWRNASTGELMVWFMSGGSSIGSASLGSVDVSWRIAGLADFNGDGKPDVFWRNVCTGENYVWYMDGVTVIGSGSMPAVADRNWKVVGVGDFNNDDKPDIVWRYETTGDNYVWYMDGVEVAAAASLPGMPDQNWKAVGVADLNNDGNLDIFWRNTSTGENYVWYLDGVTVIGGGNLPAVSDQNWKVMGVGDYNGDGWVDVVWRNSETQENYVWYVNNMTVSGSDILEAMPDSDWWMFDIGESTSCSSGSDFDGDGQADLVWRNTSTGEVSLWLMDGVNRKGEAISLGPVDLVWKAAGLGDFNDDSKPDIVWRNVSTGENYVWYLDGVTVLGGGVLPTVADQDWNVVGVADFNNDDKPDVLWRNVSSGDNYVWYMDGVTVLGGGVLPTVADLDWNVGGVADFNNDDKPDVVWRNVSSGDNYVWYMDGVAVLGGGVLPTIADLNWEVGGVVDFNNDDKPDILWRHAATGDNYVWYLDGVTVLGGGNLPTVADQSWTIVP